MTKELFEAKHIVQVPWMPYVYHPVLNGKTTPVAIVELKSEPITIHQHNLEFKFLVSGSKIAWCYCKDEETFFWARK